MRSGRPSSPHTTAWFRSAFSEHRGTEISHTGDGFFVSFDRGIDAVEAAVAIQRRLTEHSRDQGFAPSVRIGIHTDEATVDGNDYRGLGVHRAARVSAAAEADEIVVSAAALEAADAVRFPVSEGRGCRAEGDRRRCTNPHHRLEGNSVRRAVGKAAHSLEGVDVSGSLSSRYRLTRAKRRATPPG